MIGSGLILNAVSDKLFMCLWAVGRHG